MTRTLPDWAYLNDASGEHWYHLSKGTRLPFNGANGERTPQRAVYAIPSRDLVSCPQWVSSKEPEIISQVVASECEKLGLPVNSGPGQVSDWTPVKYNGTRTLIQSVAIPWEFEVPSSKSTQFTDFVPQYSFFPAPTNSIVLWKEGDEWVAGYTREDKWAHIQPLGELAAPQLAAEIQLTLMELNAKGIVSGLSRVIVWGQDDPDLLASLTSFSGLPAEYRPLPSPTPAAASRWQFEPHSVSIRKREQKQRKRAGTMILATFFVLICLAAAAFFHLWTLQDSNRRISERISANRETADTVSEAMEQWRQLSPAIEPERSTIELFYQVGTLLPERGVRITSFEIQNHRTISITGEASTMSAGLKLNADLQESLGLSDYEWEDFQPRQKGDILEFNATGRYRFGE